MKKLILVRHANALSAYEAKVTKDSLRPLSTGGVAKAAQTAQKLKQAGYAPQLILHSPLLRAQQTAQELAKCLPAPLQACPELDGCHEEQEVCDFLTQTLQQTHTLLAVGHNPNIAMVLNRLCGKTKHFSPGAFAVLDMTDPNHPIPTYFEE